MQASRTIDMQQRKKFFLFFMMAKIKINDVIHDTSVPIDPHFHMESSRSHDDYYDISRETSLIFGLFVIIIMLKYHWLDRPFNTRNACLRCIFCYKLCCQCILRKRLRFLPFFHLFLPISSIIFVKERKKKTGKCYYDDVWIKDIFLKKDQGKYIKKGFFLMLSTTTQNEIWQNKKKEKFEKS